MQDNILASSNLIQGSMMELDRAIRAADTTMSNAINAFNQLNHTKFLENVVEDIEEADKKQEIERLEEETKMNNTTFIADTLIEKDKITYALELAINEVSRKKKGQAEGGEEGEEGAAEKEKDAKRLQREQLKKGFIGVAAIIKLPFVIGQPEFEEHPYAGLVACNHKFDQIDHFKEEREARMRDKEHEQQVLQENAANIADADAALVDKEGQKEA